MWEISKIFPIVTTLDMKIDEKFSVYVDYYMPLN